MRVTDKSSFIASQRAIAQNREHHTLALSETSTGIRVAHPGEDPTAAGLISQHMDKQQQLVALATSVTRANDELTASDGALASAGNLLLRAREVAIRMSNASYNSFDRAAAAVEIDAVKGALVSAMNAEDGGRYVFGGTQDGAPPFDASGNYSGDANVRQIEVGPGVQQTVSVRADIGLKGANGGVDVFATLNALATALRANDPVAVRATLGDLDSGSQQVASMRTQLGTTQTVLDAVTAAATLQVDDTRTSLSNLEEVDPLIAATHLAQAEQALEASLAATARSFQITLLKRI